MAVVVPRSQLARAEHDRRARRSGRRVTYHALLNRTPQLIGAPTVWGPTLATAGAGMKIGIIDDGLDQTHVFFDPTGFTYPAGLPEGEHGVHDAEGDRRPARSRPRRTTWKYANTPFDPQNSDHATNVAGIAAGDHDTIATSRAARPRSRASRRARTSATTRCSPSRPPSFGLDGNSPEIAKGIEEAVKDGMDVINLSLGEPEIEPTRDIVVAALDNAADAGVVPVVAAGNDSATRARARSARPGTRRRRSPSPRRPRATTARPT